MTKESDPKKVAEEMAKKNSDSSQKKLTFDPTTGELIIKPAEDETLKPNEIIVDQIYKDGFF
ncbi:MAG: hypothetical protein KatS3mg031_2690 [Chitinophagales bacterium]|nr:MAG: hypothetical protein KatS3mg031_2690 [Chitinophagales bacterium]